MSFLHPWFLLAGLGVALPILAHLLNRFQVQRTDWAAMRFLDRSVRVRSRQLKLRDILLLILRCLALLLLVVALARPAWHGGAASWIPGEKRAGVIIALDASFSMQHGPQGQSRFDRALRQLAVIREKIQPGDPVTLLLLGGRERLVAHNMVFDNERWDALMQDVKATPSTIDWEGVPKRLQQLADGMDAADKEIYLVTDTQQRDWKNRSVEFHASLKQLDASATVVLVPLPGEPTNLAVTGMELVSGTLRKGGIARYQATIRNCGSAPAANVDVRCRVEGTQIDSKTIPLIAPGASETVSLFVPFHNAGATRITAEIAGDLLASDNIRRTVALVREQVSVLCVDGSGGDAGRLITAALMARGDAGSAEEAVIRSIPWLAFPAEDLSKADVIILADVPELTLDQVAQLTRFVREGNGLIWFAGDDVKVASWNERAAQGQGALLPAALGQGKTTSDALGAGIPIDPDMPDHSVCHPLQSLAGDLLIETRFLKCLDLKPSASSFTVLQLAGGNTPILLEKSLGRGQVFQFSTTAQATWNNMALTPVFPMLMQQMVSYLAAREFERPQTVGDTLTLSFVEQPDASDAVFDSPSGKTLTVPVRAYRDQFVALMENADEAGFYLARVSVQSAAVPVAVNVDTLESDVACMTAAEISEMCKSNGITIAADEAALAATIDTTRTGRSSWRTFLIAALAFLLIECLLADRLMRRQNVAESESPTSPSGDFEKHHA